MDVLERTKHSEKWYNVRAIERQQEIERHGPLKNQLIAYSNLLNDIKCNWPFVDDRKMSAMEYAELVRSLSNESSFKLDKEIVLNTPIGELIAWVAEYIKELDLH